jgi:alanyl-tRNA synthetase
MTSTPQSDIAGEVERMLDSAKELKVKLAKQELRIADLLADTVNKDGDITVVSVEGLSRDALRKFASKASVRIGSTVVALCKDGGMYSYVICSDQIDLRPVIKEANLALGGRGGGSASMVQGSFAAQEVEIRAYFNK